MLKYLALALLLVGQRIPQFTLDDYESRASVKIQCMEALPDGFSCGIVYNLGPSLPEGIASIVGGQYDAVREISLILNGTLYTAVCDPPWNRVGHIANIKRNTTLPARVQGNNLVMKWSDSTEIKSMIIRREVAEPTRPQPA